MGAEGLFSIFVDMEQNFLLIAFQSTKQTNKQTTIKPNKKHLASHAHEDFMSLYLGIS